MNVLKNTTLSVGLLNTPVKIVNATSRSGDIKFSICGPNGEELERVHRVKDTEDQFVAHDEMGKTFEGHRVDLTELANIEETCAVDEEGNDLAQIMVDFFMPLKDVPMERTEDLYYIVPNLSASTSDSLLHFTEGLRRKKVAAIAKVVLKSRQKLLALFVKDGLLFAASLRFTEAMVPPTEEVEIGGTVNRKVLAMMGQLIDATMGDANDLAEMEDTFVARKRELVAKMIAKGEKVEKSERRAPKTPKSNDLLEALEASVAQKRGVAA